MTKKLFSLIVAFAWATTMMAQNIAVVSPTGDTSLYKTLQEAVDGAEDGSVVYLPGGKVNLNDGTAGYIHITKKLTIIGVGHKSVPESPDATTFIDGFVYFDEGSSGSALMGCHLDDYLSIKAEVNDIVIRHNRLYSVYTGGKGTFISHNYVSSVYGCQVNTAIHSSDISVSHNIIGNLSYVDDGDISNNIFYVAGSYNIYQSNRSSITDNILFGTINSCSDNYLSGNMSKSDLSEDGINVGDVSWGDVFVNYNSSNPFSSDWHFKDEYKQYEDQVGIYAGSGFSDKQLAPVPYIVSKRVDDQTDAQGKLSIKVRVNAGDAE
ncbi:MAG: hypothetical protein K6A96_07955 [Prevotella sp.]|nr:hypothetical protein [Prevotella sp.]